MLLDVDASIYAEPPAHDTLPARHAARDCLHFHFSLFFAAIFALRHMLLPPPLRFLMLLR